MYHSKKNNTSKYNRDKCDKCRGLPSKKIRTKSCLNCISNKSAKIIIRIKQTQSGLRIIRPMNVKKWIDAKNKSLSKIEQERLAMEAEIMERKKRKAEKRIKMIADARMQELNENMQKKERYEQMVERTNQFATNMINANLGEYLLFKTKFDNLSKNI